ncbi:hypothetical protein RIF29_22538 [Crotalaria pallida]|uniref:Uncharacterized protein n=1 Tax=Crotalaria pallida TaxID=3830 RepID=A0AAN9IEJ5_CROPI
MATLQKFKLFTSHCGAATQSSTQSPRTSPLVQLRRPKTTLQTLLCLNRSTRRRDSPLLLQEHSSEKKGRNSLKDLFVSSPPGGEEEEEKVDAAVSSTAMLGSVGVGNLGLGGPGTWAEGFGPRNPGWMGFRCRSLLKRKAWRPLLLTIHE